MTAHHNSDIAYEAARREELRAMVINGDFEFELDS